MKKYKTSRCRHGVLLQALAVYAWLTVLSPLSVTDTYYSVYLLCGSLGLLCLWDNYRCGIRMGWTMGLLGGLFSLAVAAANYSLYTPLSVMQNAFDLACLLLGGAVVGCQILAWMERRLPLAAAPGLRRHPGRVFVLSFAAIALIDLGFLFFVRYPGVLTRDSEATLAQIMGDLAYQNTMPFWHTVTVQPFIRLGLHLFGDMNAAVATFHTAQILFVAVCMAAAVATLYQAGVHLWVIGAVFGLYAFMPHNIAYSVTLWKDIPFGAAALLLVTALYRLLKGMGRFTWVNYAGLVVGALGFCLWRTNGWYAFAATLLVMALFLGREHRGLLLWMGVICLVCWLLIGPVLEWLGVASTDLTEAFCVPMQQMGRVIWLDRPLDEEQTRLLSELFWLDRVKELYEPNNADPVKFYTFRHDNLAYIRENWQTCLGLYLKLGLQYPVDYFQAWVEQTKGYWNGGYFYYTYTLVMGVERYGIFQVHGQNLLARCYEALFRYLEKPEILQWTVSIGLHTWVLAACAAVTARQRRREFALTVPLLVLVAGLCLGTPIYSEFRYAYPMILCAPLILCLTLYGSKENEPLR